MVSASLIYLLTGIGLIVIGVAGVLVNLSLLARVLALNVAGSGVFLIFVTLAYREAAAPDAVPHALVLTGLVVAVSATALMLAIGRRLDAGDE